MSARALGLALWLMAGGLAALALFWQARHPPQPPVVRAAPPPELPAAPPLEPFRLAPPGYYNPIMTRPLFIADRRPEPPPPPEDAAPPEKPPPGPEQKFMLFGVMIAPGTQAALVRLEEPGAKTARVKVGEMIGEWRLDQISAEGVVLRKGEEIREVPLSRPRKAGKPRGGRMGARPQDTAPPVSPPGPLVNPLAPPVSPPGPLVNPLAPPVSPPAPPPVSLPAGPGGVPSVPQMTQ